MTITAKNVGRINVWPTYDIARDADTAESKFIGRLTVWRTSTEARAHLSAEEEEGGGGEPEWVPDGWDIWIEPRIIDGFPTGRAWVSGTGIVDVDTLLGSDANTEAGWAASAYDPENLTADGYVSGPLAFIGIARSSAMAGASYAMRFKTLDVNSSTPGLVLLSADGEQAIEIDLHTADSDRSVSGSSWGGEASETINPISNGGIVGAINVLAATITNARLEFAANGSDAVDAVLTTDDYPVAGEGAIVAALVDCGNDTNALQSIGIKTTPLPSTTGLSALSETGVVNTAPTGITAVEWTNGITGTPPTGTIDDAGKPDPDGSEVLAGLAMVDPEGNPGVFTLTDDGGGKFVLGDGVTLASDSIGTGATVWDVGANNFTLRATDPGGLYVEQEFTITVTA